MKYIRLDDYWSSIGEMIGENGILNTSNFFCLSNAVFSISQGNVARDRGLSINKYLLPIHGIFII